MKTCKKQIQYQLLSQVTGQSAQHKNNLHYYYYSNEKVSPRMSSPRSSTSISTSDPCNLILFFPGDVQHLQQNMNNYHSFSYEHTSHYLLHKFLPISHSSRRNSISSLNSSTSSISSLESISGSESTPPVSKISANQCIIVEPCMMNENTFSVYSNFTQHCDGIYGTVSQPNRFFREQDWSSQISAMKQLFYLLQNASTLSSLQFEKMILVGFSKGCVVLNQLLYEMAYCFKAEEETTPNYSIPQEIISIRNFFMQKVQQIYWLDSGNSQFEAYISEKTPWKHLIQQWLLTKPEMQWQVHVSPYTWNDTILRKHNKQELEFIKQIMQEYRVSEQQFQVHKHSMQMKGTMAVHFNVIIDF